MSLFSTTRPGSGSGFPRVSGDEPRVVRVSPTPLAFSPRERG